MDFIEIVKAVVQGIVQGITEWLPISSTGHILLLDAFWKMNCSQQFFDVFKVVIQLGSILAVVVLYFHRLNPFSSKKTPQQRSNTLHLWARVLVASIPAGVVGIAIDDIVDEKLSTPVVIAAALIIYGVAFIWLEHLKLPHKITDLSAMPFRTALGIGAFQMLALIPGTSRSGSTILGASLLGTSRKAAAEFSFFMAIPVMVGASGVKVLKFLSEGLSFTATEWVLLGVASLVSFLVSLLVIRFLIGYLQRHDFKVFGYYRIVLGILVLLAVAAGQIR